MTNTKRRDPDDGPLWTSASPRFGVVRQVVVDGLYAAQFDDLNGDYREVCLTVFRRDGSTWEELLCIDDAGYPDVGEEPCCGYSHGYAWAAGRDLPGARISVLLRDEPYTVQADAEGWWLFVRRSEPPDDWVRSPGSFLRFATE